MGMAVVVGVDEWAGGWLGVRVGRTLWKHVRLVSGGTLTGDPP